MSTPASALADTAPGLDRPRPAVKTVGFWRRLLRHRNGRIGLAIMLLIVLVGVVGPFAVHWSASANADFQNLSGILQSPSLSHPLGTDQFGRDEAVRLVNGTRYTVGLGLAAVLLGLVIGVPLGAISGYLGGWVDAVVQRLVDILMSFPSFLLALGLLAALGPGLKSVIVAAAIGSVPRFVRLLRGSILRTRELPYVEAARALGMPSRRLLAKHVVPNSFTPVITQIPLELGNAILTIAGVGFLGLGVQQPTPEWGSMLGTAQDYIFRSESLVAFPGLCIFAVALGANLLGDGVRDVLDPTLR
jgi:peptide/nickel transport system permease protein